MVYTKRGQQNKRRGMGLAGAFLVLAGFSSSAEAADAVDSSRVRSANLTLLESFREGAQRSPTFAAVVDAIARSNGIVYVEFGYCAFGHLNGCLLPFIATSEGTRYLRIVVTPDKTRQSHDQLLALLAHEMHHAREVLEHVGVSDLPAMQLLYRKIGTPIAGPQGGFETTAALAVGDAVLSELSRNRRPATSTSDRSGAPGHR